MDIPQNIIEAYLAVYREAMSDVADQPEFARRAAEILKKRKVARTPEAKAAKKAAAFFDKSVIAKKVEESSCGCDTEETPSIKKDKKNKVMDAREIPTQVNLIKTRLRLMGLNMSYEPEGEMIEEVNTPDDNGFTKCWPGKKKEGFKMKGGKKVNNCVPKEEFVIEKEMTDKEVKAENKLKSKYDPSGMKASMIKQYGEEKGEQIYFATIRKKAMEEQLDYIEEKARGTRPKRTVHAYDVDETLFSHGKKGKPNVQVHVKDESGKRVKSLSNQEFNTHKLDKGHSYDFGEFQSAKTFSKTSTPNKKIIADLKRRQARGQNVHLITARSKFDKPSEFKGHLEKHGIETPMSNIHYTGGMKGGDIGKKKVDVASAIAKKSGTKSMHMHDDAAKVHKAFEAEKQNKPTSTKIKTHMIKPNKSGEPTSRSYQATKEDFELIYDYILEQLVLEGLAEDYDSAVELTEEFDSELLEDLMREAITALAASAPEPKRPEKKGPQFASPYKNKKLPKKDYMENFTPYEFWMNIIETQQPEETEEVVEEEVEEIVEEGPTTSYQKWKQYLEEAPYTGRPVGRDAMISNNIARASKPTPTSTPTSTSSSSTSGPGTLEKVGSTLGAKVGGFIGQNRGTSTGIPGAGTIGRVIGSNKGSSVGGRLGKTADTVVNSLRQPKPTSGGTSTRPGDGKPYADGPLWNGGGGVPKSKPKSTSGGTSTRPGDGKPYKEGPLW